MSSMNAAGALLLSGVPDDGQLRVGLSPSGGARIRWPGTAVFEEQLSAVYSRVLGLVLPLPSGVTLDVPRWPVFNHMADADRYARALSVAGEVVDRLGTPCFNHPASVMRTTRDNASSLLADIPGLLVPACIRITPAHPRDFPVAVATHGLSYPVIVRLTGTQTSQTQLLIEHEADWNKVMLLPWGGAQVYITQYVDYRDEDGWYRKLRLFSVGDRFFPRHLRGSRTLSINGPTADKAMEAEEGSWLESFDRVVRPGITLAVEEIRRRIGLDFFGIDASLRPDGRLLIFEVTACMDAFGGRFGGAEPPQVSARRIAVTEAVRKLLLTPDAWNGSVAAGPALTADAASL